MPILKQQEAAAKCCGKRLVGWNSDGASAGKKQKETAGPTLRYLTSSTMIQRIESWIQLDTRSLSMWKLEMVAQLRLLPADPEGMFSTDPSVLKSAVSAGATSRSSQPGPPYRYVRRQAHS